MSNEKKYDRDEYFNMQKSTAQKVDEMYEYFSEQKKKRAEKPTEEEDDDDDIFG